MDLFSENIFEGLLYVSTTNTVIWYSLIRDIEGRSLLPEVQTHDPSWWRCARLSRNNVTIEDSSHRFCSHHTKNAYHESDVWDHFYSGNYMSLSRYIFGPAVFYAFIGLESVSASTLAEKNYSLFLNQTIAFPLTLSYASEKDIAAVAEKKTQTHVRIFSD